MKSLILCLIRLLGRLWCRARGAEVDGRALIHGLPHISRKPGGRIILESGSTLNAARWSNPLNDGRSTTLFTGPDAVIHFRKDSGASSSRIIAFKLIEIGESSLIGAGCLICDSDMHEIPLGIGTSVQSAPIHIGRNVFIGANCTILKGVSIGDGAVIGAASLVCHDIPAGALAAGNPAKVIKTF